MITGVLAVDKSPGWTSHDVVARVRRVAGQRQVGHAGTLDPLATGVLLLVLGGATRMSGYLMESTKIYCAEVVLGARTATDDAEAPLLDSADTRHLDRAAVEACLRRFTGEISQVPPAYAAVRVKGERLYKLARRGMAPAPAPRMVNVYSIDLQEWAPPRLRIRVACGPGTYIRALARDLGDALGVGGYLHALRRVASGLFTLADCQSIDVLSDPGAVRAAVMPPDVAVLDWPAAILTVPEERAVRSGRPVSVEGPGNREQLRLYDGRGRLVALGERRAGLVKPFRVFSTDVQGGVGE